MIRTTVATALCGLSACLALVWPGHAAYAQSAPAKAKPAAAPHNHGRAKLMVAIDGHLLTLEFESPLENLVGFEHAPRTDKQRAALQGMADALQKADAYFVPAAAARCAQQSVKLESAVLDAMAQSAAAKGKPVAPAAVAQHASHDGHAEIEATIVFRCEEPAQLRMLEVKLFDRFPGIKRLDAQVVWAQGQKAQPLTAGSRRIAW